MGQVDSREIKDNSLISDEQFKITLDHMMEGCQIISPDWRYIYLNEAAIVHSHKSKEELLGHTMMESYPGIEKTEMFAILRECMEIRVHHQLENEFIYPDGTQGWFELRVDPVPQGIFVLSLDISERKESEETLKQYKEQLEQLLKERTMELDETKEKMIRQEKLAMIGKLAGSVAHELRNPLGVISNSAYFLNMKISRTDEKIRKHLKLILEESTKANTIITDLLDFAQTKPEESQPSNINDLLRETLETIQKSERIRTNTLYDSELPNIAIDPRKIQQAFSNIIINAYQAMPEGGKLMITTKHHDRMIEIVFKDTGVGIPTENLSKLFDPLFSTKMKGIGLGLTITKEIIEHYKGIIEVSSAVGVGSTFTIKLPF